MYEICTFILYYIYKQLYILIFVTLLQYDQNGEQIQKCQTHIFVCVANMPYIYWTNTGN